MPCGDRPPGVGAGKTAGKMSRRYRVYAVKDDFSQCINGVFSSSGLIPVPEACLTPISVANTGATTWTYPTIIFTIKYRGIYMDERSAAIG